MVPVIGDCASFICAVYSGICSEDASNSQAQLQPLMAADSLCPTLCIQNIVAQLLYDAENGLSLERQLHHGLIPRGHGGRGLTACKAHCATLRILGNHCLETKQRSVCLQERHICWQHHHIAFV